MKIGDIVIFNENWPPMTIGQLNNDGTVQCQWFVGTELYEQCFNGSMLSMKDFKVCIPPSVLSAIQACSDGRIQS